MTRARLQVADIGEKIGKILPFRLKFLYFQSYLNVVALISISSGRGSPPPKLHMDSDSSSDLSNDSWEEETLSKFDMLDGNDTSLPRFNHLESLKSMNSTSSQPNSFIKKSITQNVREISLNKETSPQRPKRRVSKLKYCRFKNLFRTPRSNKLESFDLWLGTVQKTKVSRRMIFMRQSR